MQGKIVLDIEGHKIINYIDAYITEEINENPTLEFEVKDPQAPLLQPEMEVKVNGHTFILKETTATLTNSIKAICRYDTRVFSSKFFTEKTWAKNTLVGHLKKLTDGTGWVVDGEAGGVELPIETHLKNGDDIIEELKEVFGKEILLDNLEKKVIAKTRIGKDNGVFVSKDINLMDAYVKSDSYDYFNVVVPVGKDGLLISSVNNGSPYIKKAHYLGKPDVYQVYENTDISSASTLKTLGQEFLEKEGHTFDVFELEINDLSARPGYDMYSVGLGDEVKILDFRKKHRIVKKTVNINRPQDTILVLGNKPIEI